MKGMSPEWLNIKSLVRLLAGSVECLELLLSVVMAYQTIVGHSVGL